MKTSVVIACCKSIFFLIGAALAMLPGCAVEVENPDNPAPISPRRGTTGGKEDGHGSASPAGEKSSHQPAASVPLPTVNCNVSISRGSANSSGKEGAVVELDEASASDGSSLLLRTLSTASFIEVKDIVFGSGVFLSGNYTLEYRNPNGLACFVVVSLLQEDIDQKLKLSLNVSLPQ